MTAPWPMRCVDRTNKPLPAIDLSHLHGKAHEFTTKELADAEREIERIAAREPYLTDFGIDVHRSHYRSPREYREAFTLDRALLFHPMSLADFIRARTWLAQWPKTRSINQMGTSYGLKHIAAHTIGYVTNGVFIAAAISAGFRCQAAGPSARFNISSRAWTHELSEAAG